MQKKLMLALLTLLVAPVLIVAQKTSYDFEKSANFAAFKTYAHKNRDARRAAADRRQDRRRRSTRSSRPRGFRRPRRSPTYSSSTTWRSTRRRTSRPTAPAGGGYGAYGWGWGGGWAGGTTTTQVRDILMGTMVIDMADAKKGQLVWRGMGVKEVNTQAKPEKRDKSINKAVEKIFKNYPPKVEK